MPRFVFRAASATEQKADVLVLPFFEGPTDGPGMKEVGRAIGADLTDLLKRQHVKGKLGDALSVPLVEGIAAQAVLLVGLGKKEEATPDAVRRAIGKVASRLSRFASVATTVPQAVGRGWEDALSALVEGVLLGSYRFDRYKANGDDEAPDRLRTVTVLGAGRWDARAAKRAIDRGVVLAEATAWTRDLVNMPPIEATPAYLASEARAMARKHGLQAKVWSRAELERGGFGGILGVGSGSRNEPRLIELRYDGGSGAPIGLAGKGITFDSGGLSLKDAKGMEWMKCDMAGAASILGTMQAVARLKPPVNVVAAIPSAENMPGGSAIRPGDVLRHRGGKTSEVLNTDAEGRLILADALAYLTEKKPSVIVDTATLTGACVIALGEELWGVMGSDRGLVRELLDAGEAAGEPGWELPLWDGYKRHIESQIAEVKNIGARGAGTITAALFLKHFVGDVPWAHLDIAGTAYSERPGDYWPRGATGSPVRTLVRFIEGRANGKRR